MAKGENKSDTDSLTFEQAIKELTVIVNKIEAGDISLQASIEQYERGMALISRCRKILKQAEEKIEKISQQQDASRDSRQQDE